MNYNKLCFRCFSENADTSKPCPRCGYKNSTRQYYQNALNTGSLLNKRYIVGVALGAGGFGVTYKCYDTKVGGICVIKEYFPVNCAMRSAGTSNISVATSNLDKFNKIRQRFVDEADLLKKLKHRNIIHVYDTFFENNTAYYVMEYCNGIDLRKYTDNFRKKLDYNDGLNIMFQIMKGLEYIHARGILHRDIAPDNIYITKNKTVKILDFGSARYEMDQMNRNLSVIVKVGYAPVEQYGGREKQGSYTDIYALGATFYHLFTSIAPIDSTKRVIEDKLMPFSSLRPDLPDNLKYCIEKAMNVTVSGRIQDVREMLAILGLENVSYNNTSGESKYIGGEDIPIRNMPVRNEPIRHEPIRHEPIRNVRTPENRKVVSDGKRATMGQRLGAYVIDVLFFAMIYVVICLFIVHTQESEILFACAFPFFFMIFNIMTEIISNSSPGKGMLGLYIAGEGNSVPDAGQILLRNLVRLTGIVIVFFIKDDDLLTDRVTNVHVYSKK